jgi:hypothetical protein
MRSEGIKIKPLPPVTATNPEMTVTTNTANNASMIKNLSILLFKVNILLDMPTVV